jgi:GTP-binding nuclear protein Ran
MNSMYKKIVLLGDGGCGKTAFLIRHITGEFEKRYLATLGCEVNPLPFYTNQGEITFNVWDTAGQEKFAGLRDGYYLGSDGAIVFFDLTSRVSFYNVESWITKFRGMCPNAKIILVGNKCDVKYRKVSEAEIKTKYPDMTYYDISAKSNYNFDRPWLQLARHFMSDPDLVFMDAPATRPPEVQITPELIAQFEAIGK